MFNLVYTSSTSAFFEIENNSPYYAPKAYRVFLDGKEYGGEQVANTFSIFGLTPATKYSVSISTLEKTLEFTTKSESAAINILDFNAVGDGKTLNTFAIQSAINVCPRNGRVIVPQGTFYTAPITLKSNITLELQKGAKLLASTKVEHYPIIPGEIDCAVSGEKVQCATWEGTPVDCYQPFVSAYSCDNVAIVGEGEIDGNGTMGIWYINHKAQKIGRPRLVFLNDCNNVVIHGITGSNSASWTFHPYFSKNVSVLGLNINADKYSPNTDGCNPESCDGVNIIGTVFSVGDDCIAIKSGKMYMGAKYKTPSQNINIRNCLMQFGHGGVVLGSEMSGGVKNITVNRCVFKSTDRGLRIKTRRGRGKDAVIDNITFENIRMEGVLAPLVINMFYFCDPDGKTAYVYTKDKLPVDDRTPYIGRFHFKDMECIDFEQAAGFFYGLPEQKVGEVFIENVRFKASKTAESGTPAMMSFAKTCLKEGLYFNNVESVRLKNVVFEDILGEELQIENVGKVERE